MDLPEYQWDGWITPETPRDQRIAEHQRRVQEQQRTLVPPPPMEPLQPNPLLEKAALPATRTAAKRKPRPAARNSQRTGRRPGTGSRSPASRQMPPVGPSRPVSRDRQVAGREQPRDALGRFARSGQALLRGVRGFLNGEVAALGAPTTLKRLPPPATVAAPLAPSPTARKSRSRKSATAKKEPGLFGRARAVVSGEYGRQRRQHARARAVAQLGELDRKPVRRKRRRVPAHPPGRPGKPRKKRGWFRRLLRRLL